LTPRPPSQPFNFSTFQPFNKVGKFRNQTQKDLNNEIRTAFRNAIIDMFGGPVLQVRRKRTRDL